MTQEMRSLIRNVPVHEMHGNYVVSAHWGNGVPVLRVWSIDDGHKAVHLCLNFARSTITLVPSLVLRVTDPLWDTVVGLLRECGVCDERNRLVKFENDEALMQGLDRFFQLLETV